MIGKPIIVQYVHREGENREIHDTVNFEHNLDDYHYTDRIYIERAGEWRFLLTQEDFLEMYLTKKRKYDAERKRREEGKQNGNI